MNESLDIVNESLVLNLSTLANVLLYLDWVLVDLSSQFRGHLDLLVCQSDVVLEDVKHGFIALEQDLVLVDIHISGGESVGADVRGIDDAEAILDQDVFVQDLCLDKALVLLV